MKKLKNDKNALLVLILEMIIGIMLVTMPTDLTRIILLVFGVLLGLGGLAEAVAYFREEAQEAAKNQKLTKGLTMVAGGVALAMYAGPVAGFLVSKINLVYGALMLVAGLSKLQGVLDILRMKGQKWYFAALNAALTLALAAIVLLSKELAVKFVGLFLVLQALVDIAVLVLRLKKFEKKPKQPKKVEEAEKPKEAEEKAETK